MPQAASPSTQAVALAARLRELRLNADLTGRQFAEATGWPASKISRIENGQQLPSRTDIATWVKLVRAPRSVAPGLTAMLGEAEQQRREERRSRQPQAPRLTSSDRAALIDRLQRQVDEIQATIRELRSQETDTERPAESYGERRPYTVAGSLDDLHGPTTGVVKLPKRLNWSGSPVYNLDTPGRLEAMYRAVLSQAMNVDDINEWIDRVTLLAVWAKLSVPPKARRLWEERFPELAGGGRAEER